MNSSRSAKGFSTSWMNFAADNQTDNTSPEKPDNYSRNFLIANAAKRSPTGFLFFG